MRKTLVTLITALTVAVSFAHAEGTPITVQIKYDSTMLSTEAGAKTVLLSVKAQATEACSFTKAINGAPSYDRACRDDLVKKAVGQIRLAALKDGSTASYVFASAETETKSVAR